MILQNDDFFNFLSTHEAPTYRAFHLFNLLQMLDGHGMVNTDFFRNISCICKKISFDDGSQLIVVTF